MIEKLIRHRFEDREEELSMYAVRSSQSKGRRVFEDPSPIRTEFQRDKDRILHCKAFRRIKHKTQVFIAPTGDHFATRLAHTLEVSQVARTISRALNLNEDLTEAIALGHDMGHPPFGHIGEDELNRIHVDGFKHSKQSLRIVDCLEKDGKGLNLTWEVRHGIVSHSKPRGDFLSKEVPDNLTLEGQVCRISDAVAYLNHDLADAFRAGLLTESDLPEEVSDLGRGHSSRINSMVMDIVKSSWSVSGLEDKNEEVQPRIMMSPEMGQVVTILREFMFQNIYIPEDKSKEGQTARRIMQLLYEYYYDNPSEIPSGYALKDQSKEQDVVDYISGMTDQYALRTAERIRVGITRIFSSRFI